MTRLQELDYRADSVRRLLPFLDWPYCILLDSGHGSKFAGRYDILAANPYLTLTTRGETTEIRSGDSVEHSAADPLSLIKKYLGDAVEPQDSLPFVGGALGYFGYDLGRRFEEMADVAARDIELPEMVIGLYDWAIVVDHHEQRSWLVGQGRDPATFENWEQLVTLAGMVLPRRVPGKTFEVLSDIRSNLDPAAYADAFARVKAHISRGDCYQVNLTQRFEARVAGDTWDAYLALRQANPAPFSGYFSIPAGQILCSSPERFLQVRGDAVETKPIKGTRPRSTDPVVDREMAEELATSTKDRAENVMIVDLLRNDLGKICRPGSIHADPMFEVESFAGVHHLVSTVRGRLLADKHPLDLLRGCFPGGSITGAPKLSAMQIIDAIEPHRRTIYCGSLGYIGFDGQMDLNIAIRTLLRSDDSIYAWAGGGIVADSQLEAEYQESFDKAATLLGILSRDEPPLFD